MRRTIWFGSGIWAGARSTSPSYTFDQLRLEQHTAAKPAKPLEGLPPTSSVMAGHIIRAHHTVRFILTLLEPHDIPDPRECGWMLEDGALLPEKMSQIVLKIELVWGEKKTERRRGPLLFSCLVIMP